MSHLLSNLVLFGRVLRAAGIEVTPDRTAMLARAVAIVGLASRADVKGAARAVLVGRREHLALFDELFDLFFRSPSVDRGGRFDLAPPLEPPSAGHARARRALIAAAVTVARDRPAGDEGDEPLGRAAWSAVETLRHKDFARLGPDEAAVVRRLLARLVIRVHPRRSRRRVAAQAGPHLDLRRALRRALRTGGEPLELAFRRRKEKPRPLVVLFDASASMEVYSRVLLPFVWAVGRASERFEAFAFGTRLTRVSRPLRQRDVDRALAQAARRVADWGGGTRIGDCLQAFNRLWARRVLGQGAVVAVVSDGWDCGEPALLGREVARLQLSCSRLLWLNPLAGSPGYQPLTRGLQAALPFVDDFLPVRDLASLEELVALLAELPARPGRSRRFGAKPH